MQTFLPYSSFVKSAGVLDDKRLANQVNESLVIYDALTGAESWRWHPATRMWRGYEDALLLYRLACMGECARRGIERDWRALPEAPDLLEKWGACTTDGHLLDPREIERVQAEIEVPKWLGWERFHAAHRAALTYKDPEWYRPRLGDDDRVWRGYLWPVADHSYLPIARRSRGPRASAKACGIFNEHHAVGSTVEVWPGLNEGPGLIGKTTTTAYTHADRYPVVFVRVPGRAQTFFLLTHVRVLDVDLDQLTHRLPEDRR